MPYLLLGMYFFTFYKDSTIGAYDYRSGKWVMKTTNCGNNKAYEPLCARPVTRVDFAAPLLLLFPLAGMKEDLPAV